MAQYVAAKIFTCYQLRERHYRSESKVKNLMVWSSFPLKNKHICGAVQRFVERLNGKEAKYYGFFYGRTNRRTAILPKRIYGTPMRVPFEDMALPVPECYDEYLTRMFGDYMTPPPPEKQVGLHLIDVDFGKY